MYDSITITNSSVNFYNAQQHAGDTIFNTRNLNNRHSAALYINNDKDFNKPDRGQYIFSTMGMGIFAMFSNNMVLPIRTKQSLNGYSTYAMLSAETGAVDKGVFIVDYYTIYNDSTADVESAIEYYLNYQNLQYDRDTINNIIEKVTTKVGNSFETEIKIRLITFVPESEINEHVNLYIDKSDILLISGNLNSNTMHPNSRYYKDLCNKTVNSVNSIEFDIVDNISTTPYFIKIGNKVEKFLPTRDIERSNGGLITMFKNGKEISSKKYNLRELGKEYGIYRTKDEADSDGNVARLAELDKLTVEKGKISLELTKIEHERNKLKDERDFFREKWNNETLLFEQKFKLAELDIAKRYSDMQISYKKGTMDAISNKLKGDVDLRHVHAKNQADLNKLNADNAFKFINNAVTFVTKLL